MLTAYVHPPANKLGVLVHARGGGDRPTARHAHRRSPAALPLP